MSHPEPEELALGALEGFTDGVRAHVEQCPACREEVAALRRVVDAGRAGGAPVPGSPRQPSEQVWTRIADELGLSAAEPSATAPAPAPVDATTHRSWWRRPTAWVAAAALVLGVVGTVVIQSITDRSDGTVVASADLEALPGWDAQGRADVEERDGERVLTVDLATAPDQGYREVWLISADLERLISLGVLTGSEGAFDLPDGLDLQDFAIVDVSAEPLDGDPAHSGDSIVRGELG